MSSVRFVSAAHAAVACFLALGGSFAMAAEPRLEQVFVTATRTPEPLDELDVPMFVIDRAAIERSLALDAAELLRTHAGMEIARAGGPGQLASLFTRGTDSNQTLVLVDGVRINPGTLGGAALQNIAPGVIDRIEVVKGPRSSLYGTEAIGGVVNILTNAADRRGVSGYLSGGRYDTLTSGLAGGWALGDGSSLGVGVDYSESAGFAPRVGNDVARGFDNLTLNLGGVWAATDTLEVQLRGWHSDGTTEYTTTVFDPVTFDSSLVPVSQDFTLASYALETAWRPRETVTLRAALTYAEDTIDQNENTAGEPLPPFDFQLTERTALDLQADFDVGTLQRVSVGALLSRQDTESLSYGLAYDADTDVNQYFIQDQLTFGSQNALVAIGVVDHETFGSHTTWNAEYGITLASATRLSFAAGTAFRAPDSTDLYGFGGNPALEPEESTQFEFGVRQRIGSAQTLTVNAFYNRIDNLIVYVFDPVTFEGTNENVEEARITGVEIGYALQGEKWAVRAQATLQDPIDENTDERLLRRAKQNYVLAVTRSAGSFAFGAEVAYAGDRYDFGFPDPVRLDPYTLVALTARYAVSPAWALQARVDNLFDESYTLVNGYNTPGRAVTLAARFAFE
jgi:vitamin B12 transporter